MGMFIPVVVVAPNTIMKKIVLENTAMKSHGKKLMTETLVLAALAYLNNKKARHMASLLF